MRVRARVHVRVRARVRVMIAYLAVFNIHCVSVRVSVIPRSHGRFIRSHAPKWSQLGLRFGLSQPYGANVRRIPNPDEGKVYGRLSSRSKEPHLGVIPRAPFTTQQRVDGVDGVLDGVELRA